MSLVRNGLWSLAGSLVPAVLAIPSAGLIARALGAERFALFLLMLAVLAMSGLLGGGVAQAVTRQAAQRGDRPQDLGALLGTGLLLVLLGSLPVLAWAVWQQDAVVQLLHPSAPLRPEVAAALPLLAVLVLLQLMAVVCHGLLEGLQRFRRLATVKLANGMLAAVLPAAWVLLDAQASLGQVLAALALARLAGLLLLLGPGLARLPVSARRLRWHGGLARSQFAFGGWVALSNLISPLVQYADRFLLSSLLGAQLAAGYLAAAELVGRAAPVPAALSTALFSRLCANPHDPAARRLAAQLMLGACGAICLVLALWGDWVLALWLGRAHQAGSIDLLRILLLGFLLNALAHLPFARLYAAGHARATALLHAAEILPFLGLLLALVLAWGSTGAAVAWSVRMAADLLALLVLERRLLGPRPAAAAPALAGL